MSLLIIFECLVGFLIWRGGLTIALGNQPERRNRDLLERQRRGDWIRNELQQRPWLLLALGLVEMIVLADWLQTNWTQRPWRRAMLWTIAMVVVLVLVVALTVHFGWSVRVA